MESSAGQRHALFLDRWGNHRPGEVQQDLNGNFGNWLRDTCPQARPFLQNAFSCPDQTADVTGVARGHQSRCDGLPPDHYGHHDAVDLDDDLQEA